MNISNTDTAQDSTLTATMHNDGDVVVLEIDGDVDMLTAPLLREAVVKSLHDDPRVLVLDLRAVRFFGSPGLAMLIEAQELAGERTRLRVVADSHVTVRPIRVTGLERQLALYPTREEALRNH